VCDIHAWCSGQAGGGLRQPSFVREVRRVFRLLSPDVVLWRRQRLWRQQRRTADLRSV